jgi:hypothetical protein
MREVGLGVIYFWRIGNFLASLKACWGRAGESDCRGGSGWVSQVTNRIR